MKKRSLLAEMLYGNNKNPYALKTVLNGNPVELGNGFPYLEDLYYLSDSTGNHLVGIYKERLTLNQQLYLLFSCYNRFVVDGDNCPENIKEIANDFTEYLSLVGCKSAEVSDIIEVGTRYIENKVDDRIYIYSTNLDEINAMALIKLQDDLDKGFNELDIVGSVEYIEEIFKDLKEENQDVDSSVIDKIDLNEIRVNAVKGDFNAVSVVTKFNENENTKNKILDRIMEKVYNILQEELSKLNDKGDE